MAVPVDDVRAAADDVPGLGRLGGNVGMGYVQAGVDDCDLDRACRAEDLLGHLVLAGDDVLPLVGQAGAEHRRERGLDMRRCAGGARGRRRCRGGRRARRLAGQLDLDRLHVRHATDDPRAGEALQSLRELLHWTGSRRRRGTSPGCSSSRSARRTPRCATAAARSAGKSRDVMRGRRACRPQGSGEGLSSVVGLAAGVRYP